MKNQDHIRMRGAVNFVHELTAIGWKPEDGKAKEKKECSQYRSRVLSCATQIHDAGLMQTLAFYLSKDEESARLLASQIMRWMLRGTSDAPDQPLYKKADMNQLWSTFNGLSNHEDMRLLWDTEEILSLLIWLRRFAEARFKKGEEA